MKIRVPVILAALFAATAGGRAAVAQQQAEWAAVPVAPRQQLADFRRIDSALAAFRPQRPGVVDAYVIVVALDADPVFGREAREAGRVLASRFDAAGRTLVLASDEGASKADAIGSPHHLALALARVAEVMDRNEDVLVLYSTSHGMPEAGLTYRDFSRGVGIISPARLAGMIDPLGFRNRLLILQACYSGQFVPALAEPGTIVVTAAAADRSSFGCHPGNDWTLFGDSLVNHAFRQPAPLAVQLNRAKELIVAGERKAGIKASNPQVSIGVDTGRWLAPLETRASKVATKPIGLPVGEQHL